MNSFCSNLFHNVGVEPPLYVKAIDHAGMKPNIKHIPSLLIALISLLRW
jgi:hypothetical protein